MTKTTDLRNTTGFIKDVDNNHSLRQCAFDCMLTTKCVAVLFNPSTPDQNACKHMIRGLGTINLTHWKGYELYMFEYDTEDPGIGAIKTPSGWTSGKPRLYFPLDSDIGTRHGVDYDNIDFTNDSIIGKAFLNPSDGTTQSYYELGNYSENEFCFIELVQCPEGASIALWVKIMGHAGTWQGIISTMAFYGHSTGTIGPGFSLFWAQQNAVRYLVGKRTDGFSKEIAIPNSKFLSDFSLKTWNHFVLTYKNNDINLYINGVPRPDSEKINAQYPVDNGQDYHGILSIGRVYVNLDGPNFMGNVKIDEVFVWERELPYYDVIRLYDAYVHDH